MLSAIVKVAIAIMALLAGFGLASSPTVREIMVKLVFEKETEAPEHPSTNRAPQP